MTTVPQAPSKPKDKDIIEAKGPASFAEKYIVRSIWEGNFHPAQSYLQSVSSLS